MNILEKLNTVGKAILKHSLDNFNKVSLEMYEQRLKICESNTCGEFKDNWTCGKCSCHLTIKANWNSENCPLYMWPNDKKPIENKQRKCCGG